MDDVVRIPRSELKAIARDLQALQKDLESVGRLRLEAARLRARVAMFLAVDDDEKTPVHSPSPDAAKAFESSSRFLAVRPPKPKPQK